MKKILVLFSLVLFVGAYAAPLKANNNKTTIVVVDEDKCPKCGKEKCDASCEAETKAAQKECTGTKAKSDCKTKCDSKKKSDSTTKKEEKKGAEVK